MPARAERFAGKCAGAAAGFRAGHPRRAQCALRQLLNKDGTMKPRRDRESVQGAGVDFSRPIVAPADPASAQPCSRSRSRTQGIAGRRSMTAPGPSGAPIEAFRSRQARNSANAVPLPQHASTNREARGRLTLGLFMQVGSPARYHGFVNTPIYRGSTILFPTVAALEANDQAFTYGRLGTRRCARSKKRSPSSRAARTLLTPSGLSAVAAHSARVLFGRRRDSGLRRVYRPTRRFCDRVLKRLGVTTTITIP